MYNKGAPEIILASCTKITDGEQTYPLTTTMKESFLDQVQKWAEGGYRTLALSYNLLPDELPEEPYINAPEGDGVLQCVLGIEDPLRAEVIDAIRDCYRAGIKVRMVTGDNITTAKSIARQCGIITGEESKCIEGIEWAKLNEQQELDLLPDLSVIARCSPQDKRRLVDLLIKQGEVVAVTGDGTNDVPALKAADVGLSMGIRGTDVAKQASDIVILDDNFLSIVKSVMWGRCVFDNIRKFLQFQLTINIVALVLCVVGA